MSLVQQTMKLKAVSPLVLMKCSKHGWPGAAYYPGSWGVCSHIINRAPTVRMPFWEKIMMGSIFTLGMFTYPFYVTYKMYDWDRLDENL